MLGLPVEYQHKKNFPTSLFLKNDLTAKERSRFRDAVRSIVLEYQIAGEGVPSLVNDEYDCQAILFFGVKLNSLKDATFVCGIIQKLVKTLCVVRCFDLKGMQTFSFAHKRLNLQDRTQVVVEDSFLTAITSIQLPDDTTSLMNDYLAYDQLRNKSNKMTLYFEFMTKAFLITNRQAWSGSMELLASKVWYNVSDMVTLFALYKRVVQLQKEKKSSIIISDQAELNAELKRIYSRLSQYMEGK